MTQREEFEAALKKHEINCCMFERGVQTLDNLLLSRATFLKAAQPVQGCPDIWEALAKYVTAMGGDTSNVPVDSTPLIELVAAITCVAQPSQAQGASKSDLIYLYNAGYKSGHHDTVESQYTDVTHHDMRTYHHDVIEDLISEGEIAQSAQPTEHPAAQRQARELSGDEIQAIWVEHGIDECDPETFARAILAAINATEFK